VRVHTGRSTTDAQLSRVWLESKTGDEWKSENTSGAIDPADHPALATDQIFKVQVAPNAEPTQPYFTRPSTEQPYYDLTNPAYRERSFAPWPLLRGRSSHSTASPSASARSFRPCIAFWSRRHLRAAGRDACHRRAH